MTNPELPEGGRDRTSETRKRLRIKRQELKLTNDKLRNAGSPTERRKHKSRKDATLYEVFRLREELRVATGQGVSSAPGALPDFVIIGAQKGGTTSLYNLLTRHPLVGRAALKEPHFFDRHFEKGVEWYRHCFPRPVLKGGRRTVTGEATPAYIFRPEVPDRLAQVLPDARLIALLRNPVDRAYSHYHHQLRTGTETLGFEAAIEAEEARLIGEKNRVSDETSYLTRGIYADQIERYMVRFGEESLLVVKSEDFFGRPKETLSQILDFLHLPDWEPESWKSGNRAGYPPMNTTARRHLEGFFKPYNRRLYDLLGTDLGW